MEICRFIHQTHWEDLPAGVQSQTVRCLLDTLGTALAGRGTEVSRIIHEFAAESFAGRGSRLWQDGREVSCPGAAMANSMTIDSLDIHDGHSLTKGHSGAAVVPATLAGITLGGATISGKELLTSLAIGYETAIRAGITLHQTAPDYHSSGAWAALGCAAVTARRLGLSTEQTLNALGVAEYYAPRSQIMRCVDYPSMVKDGSGWGAMAGLSAGILAGRGFTGRPAVTVELVDSPHSWESLGENWELLQQYFKPHAVCRWAQPAVEGAVQLKRAHKLDAEAITAIRVETFHEATRLIQRFPRNTDEAQYSLPFPVAVALVYGSLGPEQLTGAALRDHRVLRLSQLVELSESPQLNAQFPARRFAHVAVGTSRGERFEIRDVEPRWDGTTPPSDQELLDKFRWLTRCLPNGGARDIERSVLECPDLPDASVLVERLAAAPCPPMSY